MENLIFLLLGFLWVAGFRSHDPATCNIFGALLGAGASLIGGALNRKSQRSANAANSPVGQVQQWEAAGINPAFGISSGGYIPQQAASIGDAFATAGGILGEGVQLQHAEKLKQTEIAQENEKLRKKLDELSRPRQRGYMQQYGGILPLPSEVENAQNDQNTGSDLAADVAGGGADVGTLSTAHVAPGRETKVEDYSSGAGLTELSNKFTDSVGGPVVVPGADGEPWGFDEVITAGVFGTPQIAWRGATQIHDTYQLQIGQPFADAMAETVRMNGRGGRNILGIHDAGEDIIIPTPKLKKRKFKSKNRDRRNDPRRFN